MASASTSETSCTAISGRGPGSTSPSSVLQSTWLRVSKPSPNNWGGRCCCPVRSPTSSSAISISNASANIRCAASTTQSSCLRITAECRSILRCWAVPRRRELVKRPCWRITETLDAEAAGQAAFYCCFHKNGCEEGERDGHVDLPSAAFLASAELCHCGQST